MSSPPGPDPPAKGGRLRVLHEQHELVSITTEIVQMTPESVVVRATIQTDKGTYSGTGTASAQRDARLADALVELAESRSIARSARFAGVGVEYCSAEEISHLEAAEPQQPSSDRVFSDGNGDCRRAPTPPNGGNGRATSAQCRALWALSKKARYTEEDIASLLSPLNASTFQDLTRESASQLITVLKTEVAA